MSPTPCGIIQLTGFAIKVDRSIEPVACPLWVISGHQNGFQLCPLCPQKQTLVGALSMSAKCQKRTLVAMLAWNQGNPAIQPQWVYSWGLWFSRGPTFSERPCRHYLIHLIPLTWLPSAKIDQ
jgi:hypothetical protein